MIVVGFYIKKNNNLNKFHYNGINEIQKKLIGKKVILINDTYNGYGQVKIFDSVWRIYSKTELKAKTKVIILSINGNTLHVFPLQKS
ncbi:MAG: NfeD family protein [Arsenophonus sp.]|nr:MAG: NfeD family protein [Arsenophonus sp.]